MSIALTVFVRRRPDLAANSFAKYAQILIDLHFAGGNVSLGTIGPRCTGRFTE